MDKIRANIDQIKNYVHRQSVMRKGYHPVSPNLPSPPRLSSALHDHHQSHQR